MHFRVVIPARYASSRLPGKPLADIGGRPMVLHVLERALLAGAESVVVATDDARVQQAVEAAGYPVLMTSPAHRSGTERLVEVAETLGWSDDTLVVNVQGDEPLIDPVLIREAARQLVLHDDAVMATLAHPIHDHADFVNPNVVKVVADEAGYALYFSRAPIPWPRDAFSAQQPMPHELGALRHIGLYAYRAGFLRTYASLASSPLERYECSNSCGCCGTAIASARHHDARRAGSGVDTRRIWRGPRTVQGCLQPLESANKIF